MQSLEKDQNKWVKRATVKDTTAHIPNLKHGQEYAFRVAAYNDAGMSDPREASSLVLIQDTFLAPVFDLQQFPHGVIHVKADMTLLVEVSELNEIMFFYLRLLCANFFYCVDSIHWKTIPGDKMEQKW